MLEKPEKGWGRAGRSDAPSRCSTGLQVTLSPTAQPRHSTWQHQNSAGDTTTAPGPPTPPPCTSIFLHVLLLLPPYLANPGF